MIVSKIVRSLVVAAVVAPALSLGVSLPASAVTETAACDGTPWECFVAKLEAEKAKMGTASAPAVGETLSSQSSDY
jgi:uncharacterized low-complexity protein